MTILYSPQKHGFYFTDDSNAPSDAFAVSDQDHLIAINLPPGSTYSFTPDGVLTVSQPTAAYVLSQAIAAKLEEINSDFFYANSLPISYLGAMFQTDSDSQALISNVITASGGQLPTSFAWYDVSNNPVPMSFAQLQGLAQAILLRGQGLFSNKQAKKAAARNAPDLSTLSTIVF